MISFKIFLTIILFILLFKSIYPVLNKVLTFKEEEFKFTTTVKKENIDKLSDMEFKGFCKWLLEGSNAYSNIIINGPSNNSSFDLLLSSDDNENIYVKCQRGNDNLLNKNTCEILVGSMIGDNVKMGLILTTSDIEDSALDYINNINANSPVYISLLTMKDILSMLNDFRKNENYVLESTI